MLKLSQVYNIINYNSRVRLDYKSKIASTYSSHKTLFSPLLVNTQFISDASAYNHLSRNSMEITVDGRKKIASINSIYRNEFSRIGREKRNQPGLISSNSKRGRLAIACNPRESIERAF